MLSASSAGSTPENIAGMMAKYLATSLAIENVVSEPRVISSCLPISTISMSLVGLRVEVDHVAGLLGGLRAGVHRHADVGLSQRGRVVGAVAGHRDEVAAGLLALDQRHLVLGRGLGEEVVDAGLVGDRGAVSGLSPVIMIVRMPIARSWSKRSRMPGFTVSLRRITPRTRQWRALGVEPVDDDERRGAVAATPARRSGSSSIGTCRPRLVDEAADRVGRALADAAARREVHARHAGLRGERHQHRRPGASTGVSPKSLTASSTIERPSGVSSASARPAPPRPARRSVDAGDRDELGRLPRSRT